MGLGIGLDGNRYFGIFKDNIHDLLLYKPNAFILDSLTAYDVPD